MTTEQETESSHFANGDINRSKRWRYQLIIMAAALLALALGYYLGGGPSPGPDSAEVGFARDMSQHHRQAVEMSTLIYNRTDDEIIRILAYDILTSQQAQIGIMGGWLDAWGHSWFNMGPRMEWMGMSVEGRMPGMASPDEVNMLREANGIDAEIIFLQLMIPHHQSGVMMAQAAADRARVSYVRDLAQGMANAQDAEIEYMRDLLRERGVESTEDPAATEMDMDG